MNSDAPRFDRHPADYAAEHDMLRGESSLDETDFHFGENRVDSEQAGDLIQKSGGGFFRRKVLPGKSGEVSTRHRRSDSANQPRPVRAPDRPASITLRAEMLHLRTDSVLRPETLPHRDPLGARIAHPPDRRTENGDKKSGSNENHETLR